jgi:hypothetical protein
MGCVGIRVRALNERESGTECEQGFRVYVSTDRPAPAHAMGYGVCGSGYRDHRLESMWQGVAQLVSNVCA